MDGSQNGLDAGSGVVKKRNAPNLTPEYIAEQRELREQRKKAKKQKEAEHFDVEDKQQQKQFDTAFIRRPILKVPDVTLDEQSQRFKIMTYNVSLRWKALDRALMQVLAQSLIRRELFPENGKLYSMAVKKA
jgi:RNA exonuclease NGL2